MLAFLDRHWISPNPAIELRPLQEVRLRTEKKRAIGIYLNDKQHGG